MIPRRRRVFIGLVVVAGLGIAVPATLAAVRAADTGTLAVAGPPDAPITPTAYPVPADANFVATTGNDSNAGTATAPLRTLAAAVRRAVAGRMNTVVLRGGEYREVPMDILKPVTLQPYPNEQVWLKGSAEVASGRFVADGTAWRLDNWDPAICEPEGNLDACVFPKDMNDDNPLGGDPEMVFLDGRAQPQVATRAELRAGTFFWDSPANRLYLGTDPAGRRVEIANQPFAVHFHAGAENSVVRGIGVAHYGTSTDETKRPAAVISQISGFTFENNTIVDNASAGLLVAGSGGTYFRNGRVAGNLFTRNGFNGANAHRIDGLTMERNRFLGNNVEKFAVSTGNSLAGAGVKAARLRNAVIRDNAFENNQGTGFWCDLSCYQLTIVRNLARGNTKHGIFYEVSRGAVIASNVMAGNGGYGLKLAGTNDVRVYNNTHVGNHQAVLVAEDLRPNCPGNNLSCPTPDEVALGITWDTRNVTLVNNLIAGGSSTAPLFDTIDANPVGSAKRVGADGMMPVSQMDFNGYYRTAVATPTVLVIWTRVTSGATNHTGLASFQTTGRDTHGLYQEGGAGFFVDAARGDYRVVPGSPAAAAGTSLPVDIAAAVGVPAAGPMALGAPRWPDQPTAPPPTPTPTPTPTQTQPAQMAVPLYSIQHPQLGIEILTLGVQERDTAVRQYGFVDAGTLCRVAGVASTGIVPVFRLIHPTTQDRLFTTSASERDSAVSRYGYRVEGSGTGFFAGTAPATGRVAVYRLLKGPVHRYVAGTAARDALVAAGWRYETVAFYAAPA